MFYLKALCSAAAILVVTSLSASSVTNVEVTPIEDKKSVVLRVDASGNGQVDIHLRDWQENIVYKASLNSIEAIEQMVNLESLDKGYYMLVVADPVKTTYQPILVSYGLIEADESTRKVSYKPSIAVNNSDNRLDINWMMGLQGDYQLNLMNYENEVLFESEIEDTVAVNVRYDISQLPRGSYTVKIWNEDEVHFQEIRVM